MHSTMVCEKNVQNEQGIRKNISDNGGLTEKNEIIIYGIADDSMKSNGISRYIWRE